MADPEDRARWDLPAFSVGEARYTWADVAAFARREGWWERLVGEVREGVAWQRAGLVADAAVVKAAATSFRYQRRLITGEETEAWLRARRLTVAQWLDHVRRSVLRAEHGTPAEGLPGDEPGLDSLLWATGRCGGLLDEWARALAERVAAHVRLTGSVPVGDDEVAGAVDGLAAAVVTPAAVAEVVSHRQLDWLQVVMQQAVFETEGAAREAVLSMRAEGLALAEVCVLAGVEKSSRRVYLEELDDALRAAVLGAREGEAVGPLPGDGGGFVVASVESKVVPSASDPDIRRRAEDELVARAVQREVRERVRWA